VEYGGGERMEEEELEVEEMGYEKMKE